MRRSTTAALSERGYSFAAAYEPLQRRFWERKVQRRMLHRGDFRHEYFTS